MNIANALRHLFPDADPATDYELRDDLDERGVYIAVWPEETFGPRPTAEQLQAAADAHEAEEAVAARRRLRESVNTERERRIALPLTVVVDGLGSFPVDMGGTSQRNLAGLASAAILRTMQGDTTTITFRDANNTDQVLTPQQVLQMAMQAAARIDAVYKRSWAIKALDPIPEDFREDEHWIAA